MLVMNFSKIIAAITTFAALIIFLFFVPQKNNIKGAALTSVKDTLGSSQLSYFGRLDAGNTAGNSNVIIGYTAPFITTTNLFVGDTIAIGRTSPDTQLNTYVIRDISSANTIELTAGIGASNVTIQSAVIATRSAVHTISFTPASYNYGGKFQFLLKATATSLAKAADGIPDQDGFDLGMDVVGMGGTGLGSAPAIDDISCPNLGAGTTASAVGTTTINATNYLYVECPIAIGTTNGLTAYTMTIGSTGTGGIVKSQIINPTASSTHTAGQATGSNDVYTFYIRHITNAGTVLDSTQGKVATVEAVRVTATVDPSITFTIDNILTGVTPIAVGDTVCGVPMSNGQSNVTATAVPFGSLSLGTFNNLSQRLSCVTNGAGGYIVTARAVSQLTNISGLTIPDTNCDANNCTVSSATTWATDVGNTDSGFGYSLQNISATNIGFTYVSAANWQARPFSSGLNGYNSPITLFNNSSIPSTTERAYVCYRIAINTVQGAGNYENELIYTATATF